MAKSLEEEEPSTSGSCVRVRGQIGVLPYGNDRLAHVCTAAKGDATIPTSDEPTLTEPARSPKASPRAIASAVDFGVAMVLANEVTHNSVEKALTAYASS